MEICAFGVMCLLMYEEVCVSERKRFWTHYFVGNKDKRVNRRTAFKWLVAGYMGVLAAPLLKQVGRREGITGRASTRTMAFVYERLVSFGPVV